MSILIERLKKQITQENQELLTKKEYKLQAVADLQAEVQAIDEELAVKASELAEVDTLESKK